VWCVYVCGVWGACLVCVSVCVGVVSFGVCGMLCVCVCGVLWVWCGVVCVCLWCVWVCMCVFCGVCVCVGVCDACMWCLWVVCVVFVCFFYTFIYQHAPLLMSNTACIVLNFTCYDLSCLYTF